MPAIQTPPIKGVFKQDEPAQLFARVKSVQGAYITQASLSSMTYSVWDLRTGTKTADAASLTISTVIFDKLQGWDQDAIGYNFSSLFPASCFPNWVPGQKYRVEVKFVPTDGNKFCVNYEGTVEPNLSAPL